MKKNLLSVILLCIATTAFSQLQITQGTSFPSGWTADSLVRNVLLGSGVEVFNVQFNGSQGVINCNAIGSFNTGGNGTNLGIQEGIIIGSGAVNFAAGANTQSGGSASSGCSTFSDPALTAIATGSLNDVSTLEFDFITKADTVKFNYVFASEEYPEYTCSDYNDIFGFFLSGLNPSGGMYTNYNIARIPGTDIPITINSVNDGFSGSTSASGCYHAYSQYYVDNTGGTTIQYDGFTTVLTAIAPVVPCTPYHVKMCIGDVSDGAFDSGVFLEANSFSANAIVTEFINPTNQNTPYILYEGCYGVDIVFSRPQAKSINELIPITYIGGTASNGQDYTYINNSITFPADSSSVTLHIYPSLDGEIEGEETIILAYQATPCETDTVYLTIYDVDTMAAEVSYTPPVVTDNEVTLRASVTGGHVNERGYTYRWNTGATTSEITVPTEPTAEYYYYAVDVCDKVAFSDTITVGILKDFATPSNDTTVCAFSGILLSVEGGDYQEWSTGDTSSTIFIRPGEDCMISVTSYKYWNGSWWEDADTIIITVVPSPKIELTASKQVACRLDSIRLSVTGAAQYSWNSDTNFSTSSIMDVRPEHSVTYIVYGRAEGHACFGFDSIRIEVTPFYPATITGGEYDCHTNLAILNVETEGPQVTWSSSPADTSLARQKNNRTISVSPLQHTTYTVAVEKDNCVNRESKYVEVDLKPKARIKADPEEVSLGSMQTILTDVSSNSVRRVWNFYDGTKSYNNQVIYQVPYSVDSVPIEMVVYNAHDCSDTTSKVIYVNNNTMWIPNSFTPRAGTNSKFDIVAAGLKEYEIEIFNRDGILVFHSDDVNNSWNGTFNGKYCPQGAYVYIIRYSFRNQEGENLVRKGNVMIIY